MLMSGVCERENKMHDDKGGSQRGWMGMEKKSEMWKEVGEDDEVVVVE